MLSLPKAVEPLIAPLVVAFTGPTFQRFVLLAVGATVATGRRTVTAILRTVGTLTAGHASSYHRVFSRAPWSCWTLARVLTAMVLELIPHDQVVVLSVDDTTALHKGKKVYGKGCHHDAVRSTHTHIVWKWGHKWVVLAVNVKFSFAKRPWALPVLCALYKTEELDKQEGRRHRTPIDLAKGLIAAMIHWFPARKFVLLGDGGYASHDLAHFARRHRRRLTLVSRFHADANLYDPPPAVRRKGCRGRPAKRGRKRAAPGQVVQRSKRDKATVTWYGGGTRDIQYVTRNAHWYKGGVGLVEVRWVFVHDLTGTHRDEYFYSTDADLPAEKIVSLYTARWSIEVTFQEVREHVGFETTKQRVPKSVLRAGPCLLGLFSLVSVIYAKLTDGRAPAIRKTPWYHKTEPTFSDALYAVRRLLWQQTILKQSAVSDVVSKLPPRFKTFLLDRLAAVA